MSIADLDASFVGQTIGNYQVLQRVGRGGMGDVYQAVHPEIGRKVAIKVLLAELTTYEEVASRFVDEARAVNRIENPNIIEIFDFGRTSNGRLYFTMEWLDGVDLSRLIDSNAPLALPDVAEILQPLTNALDAAHAHSILHRDIKPDNVFLALRGGQRVVKVLDFGIAKLFDDAEGSHEHTATGLILGTPRYMSPEQAAGKHSSLTPASDIYSVGVILYEMLSGEVPIDAPTSVEVLSRQITGTPTPLRDAAPGLPDGVYDVVADCLAKNPDDRPHSAGDVYARFCDATGMPHPGAGIYAPPRTSATGSPSDGTGPARAARGLPATRPNPPGAPLTKRAWFWPTLAALLALLVGTTIWYVAARHPGDGRRTSSAAANAPDPDGGASSMAMTVGARHHAIPASIQRPATHAARPSRVQSRLHVSAAGGDLPVELWIDDAPRIQRRAPFELRVRDGRRVRIRARRAGFDDYHDDFRMKGDRHVRIRLIRRHRRRRPGRRVPPRPRRVPPPEPRRGVGVGILRPMS